MVARGSHRFRLPRDYRAQKRRRGAFRYTEPMWIVDSGVAAWAEALGGFAAIPKYARLCASAALTYSRDASRQLA